MSWETQGHHPTGRLVKHYCGKGPAAKLAAEEDQHKRTLHKQARLDQQHLHQLDTQLLALTNIVQTFVTATFLGAGYYKHHSSTVFSD